MHFVQYLFFFKKWLVKQVQYLCFVCFPSMFVVSWYFYAVKRVYRNEAPVYNIVLLRRACLTWDGWLCNCPVGIDQVKVWWDVVACDVIYADDIFASVDLCWRGTSLGIQTCFTVVTIITIMVITFHSVPPHDILNWPYYYQLQKIRCVILCDPTAVT